MGFKIVQGAWLLAAMVSLAGCGATARLAVADGTGPNPTLPAPSRSLLPTVNVVSAKGWAGEEKPVSKDGLTVAAFARSYFGSHVDTRVKPQRPDLVATATVPDYALGPHTASLGLAHSRGTSLPPPFANGMFIGQHGSWNRKPRSGYRVIFVPFTNGTPSGMPVDVLSGFVRENGDAMGRPVGVAIDRSGALLVADDVGNVVWRVSSTQESR